MDIDTLSPNAAMAWQTIHQQPAAGIPSWLIHPMDHGHIERLAGREPGSYRREPEAVYLQMQKNVGTGLLDQWIPTNPLNIGPRGYERPAAGVNEGLNDLVLDGISIDSPESVVEHLNKFVFPNLRAQVQQFDEDAYVAGCIEKERQTQTLLGPDMLKGGYGYVRFPRFAYYEYGYESYFMAYAVYPEIIEKHFSLQADLAVKVNAAVARAWREGDLPPIHRLDHDMADGRGTLVDIRSLDRIWLPHFVRSIQPLLGTDLKLIWHCDGNLMQLLPRLLDVGLHGYQGFEYEHDMDYVKLCQMKTRDGQSPIVIAGVSVTSTLPSGSPNDVRDQMRFLVENGPRTGLFLAGSSSITPGVPWENMQAFVEGLAYYREHGRSGI